jgi:MSHA biogenesis protein MshP
VKAPARSNYRQRGVALIVALFVIIVLAGLGLFAMRVGIGQQQSVTLDLLGARADAAAAAGTEFGANQALRHATCAAAPPPLVLAQGALKGFSVQVSCTSNTYWVNPTGTGAMPYQVYAITATATLGVYGTPGFVSRSASKTVNNLP